MKIKENGWMDPAPPVSPQQGEGHLARTLCCTTVLTVHPSGLIASLCCYYYLSSHFSLYFLLFSFICLFPCNLRLVVTCVGRRAPCQDSMLHYCPDRASIWPNRIFVLLLLFIFPFLPLFSFIFIYLFISL